MYISDFFIQDSTSLGRLSNKCIHIAHSVLRRVSKPTHMATSNHHSVVIPSSAFPYTSFNLVWDFKPTGSVVPPVSLSRTVPETLPYASVGLPLRVAPLPLPFCTCRPCIFLPFLYARADPVPGIFPGSLLPSPLFHKELPYHPLPPKKKIGRLLHLQWDAILLPSRLPLFLPHSSARLEHQHLRLASVCVILKGAPC